MKKILVTGATGKIGSGLISKLAVHKKLCVRAFVRNPKKAAHLSSYINELFIGSFEDEGSIKEAVNGIDTVVLITHQNPQAAVQARSVIKAAKEAGVRKIVRISVFQASVDGPTEVTRLHGQTDKEIMESGMTYSILRPPFFMQNLFFMAAPGIIKERKFQFGTGEGKIGMIDLRDIVDCAEQCVISDLQNNKIYTLTGPESLNFYDLATQLTQVLELPVQFIDVSPETVEQSILKIGMGNWYAEVLRDLCKVYRKNWGDVVTNDVTEITGHAPRSFDNFAREIFAPAVLKELPRLQETEVLES